MSAAVLQVADSHAARRAAQQAGQVLSRGGVVVFPTETVYGLAAAAEQVEGCRKLAQLAQAGSGDAGVFAVHLSSPDDAAKYVNLDIPLVRRLVRKLLPGPVTLLVEVTPQVRQQRLAQLKLSAEVSARLYTSDHVVALRCPDHDLAQQVLASVPGPVLAASAPGAAGRPVHQVSDLGGLTQQVDLVIDAGHATYAKPSTVVRIVGTTAATAHWRLEREGVYDERFLRKLLAWRLLLVCSGNTCRSPMAQGLARQLLAEARGLAVEDLESAGIVVTSAGTSALPGLAASPQAVQALRAQGIDLSSHRSRPLTPDLLHEADVVYCMTQTHRQAVLALDRTAGDKTLLLDERGDVSDPFGADLAVYERSAQQIRQALQSRLKEQQP